MSGAVVYICDMQSAETLYRRMERQYGSSSIRRLIDGTVTGCNKCVGFCTYREHPGFLTQLQRQAHDCIGKGCFYYLPKRRALSVGIAAYSKAVGTGQIIRKECI